MVQGPNFVVDLLFAHRHTEPLRDCASVRPRFRPGVETTRGARRESIDKLHGDWLRDDPGIGPALQERSNRGSALFAVILGPVIDIHPDKSVGFTPIESSRKTHRMVECSGSVV